MSSSDRSRQAPHFLRTFAAALLVLAGAMLLLCWLVDPTGLLQQKGLSPSPCTPGIRTSDDRLVKPLLVSVLQPEEVIIGSSRTIFGFTAEAFGGRDIVNLALSGATLSEIDRLARHAARTERTQRVWIGLDFGEFVTHETARDPLSEPSTGGNARWMAIRHGLLDQRALKGALRTILIEHACTDPFYRQDGFAARRTAVSDAAPRRKQYMLTGFARKWEAARSDRPRLYRERLRRLDRLLSDLRERRIAVVVYLGPVSHAYLSALRGSGLDPYFQRWPEDVGRLVRKHGGTFVPGQSEAFLNPVRDRVCRPAQSMDCLFLDATHFRPEVGAAIVRAGSGEHRL